MTPSNCLHYGMVLKVTLYTCKLQQFYVEMVPKIKLLLLCRVIKFKVLFTTKHKIN